jgi:hypothetical protein
MTTANPRTNCVGIFIVIRVYDFTKETTYIHFPYFAVYQAQFFFFLSSSSVSTIG